MTVSVPSARISSSSRSSSQTKKPYAARPAALGRVDDVVPEPAERAGDEPDLAAVAQPRDPGRRLLGVLAQVAADVGDAAHRDHGDLAAVETEPAGEHVEDRGVTGSLDEDDGGLHASQRA